MTLEDQAREAIGDITLDERTLEILGARFLLVIRAALAAETEACAKTAYDFCMQHGERRGVAHGVAEAIRARVPPSSTPT